VVGADLESKVEQAYKNVLEVLRSVGATQENVVKQTILVAKGQEIRAGYAAAQRVWERIL
jgi:2-iminobutanoate/2-iminopropanoate deaminase